MIKNNTCGDLNGSVGGCFGGPHPHGLTDLSCCSRSEVWTCWAQVPLCLWLHSLWKWEAQAGVSFLAMFINAASFTFPQWIFTWVVATPHNFQGCLWGGRRLDSEACSCPTPARWGLVLVSQGLRGFVVKRVDSGIRPCPSLSSHLYKLRGPKELVP